MSKKSPLHTHRLGHFLYWERGTARVRFGEHLGRVDGSSFFTVMYLPSFFPRLEGLSRLLLFPSPLFHFYYHQSRMYVIETSYLGTKGG